MKKQIIAGIAVTTCVALCAAVWLRSAGVEELPAEPVINALSAEIEARAEEMPHIFVSADVLALKTEPVAECEPEVTEVTTEQERESSPSTEPMSHAVSKYAPASTEPKSGDKSIIDGKPYVWIPGFGWIEDEGGGSIGSMVGNPGDELTGNKVGIMGDINKQVGIMGGGDAPVNSNPISGTKKYIDGILHVWVPSFGYVPHSGDNIVTYAEDMYESGVKIGIMGGDECPSSKQTTPSVEQPKPTGDVIYTELQPPVTKDSTPPAYTPNGEPYNP